MGIAGAVDNPVHPSRGEAARQNQTMALIEWNGTRQLARGCVSQRPAITAALDEAVGAVLATALTAGADLPAFDIAATDGWALAGPGPWRIKPARSRDLLAGQAYHYGSGSEPLPDGQAVPVCAGDRVGSEVWAVAAQRHCHLEADRLRLAIAPEQLASGSGIRAQGSDAIAGEQLVAAGITVSASLIALAALAGQNELEIVPPPQVAVIRVGDGWLDYGPPRAGQNRDAVTLAVRIWLESLGARVQPTSQVTAGDAELLERIDDSSAALIITAGPYSGAAVRRTLTGLGATVIVDSVACRPGGSMLLALLPSGQALVHCGSGSAVDALATLVTVVAPIVDTLAGREPVPSLWRRIDETVRNDRGTTWLIPVAEAEAGAGVVPVRPGGPGGMAAWASAGLIGVIPPGGVSRHRRIEVLPLS